MNYDPIGDDTRDDIRYRQLGEGASCSNCGETNQDALVLEWHHTAGRNNDERVQVRLCRNCHAKLQADTARDGVELRTSADKPNLMEQLPDMLAGNGRWLINLGNLLIDLARHVVFFTSGLDAVYPPWREMPEVQNDWA
jgi:hypothetical protein